MKLVGEGGCSDTPAGTLSRKYGGTSWGHSKYFSLIAATVSEAICRKNCRGRSDGVEAGVGVGDRYR